MPLRWFAVRMAFEATVAGRNHDWEDRIVLFRGRTEKAARHKADMYGRREALEYRNSDGQRVRWQFKMVVDVAPLDIDKFDDGTEVWWELASQPMSWCKFWRKITLQSAATLRRARKRR